MLWRGQLRSLVEVTAARPAYWAGVRAATATVLPLVIGEVTGHPGFAWMALGGWLATFADPGGAYSLRARSLASYGVLGVAATFVCALVGASPMVSVPFLFLCALACGLGRVYGDGAATVGTLVLLTVCIALGNPLPIAEAAGRAGLFAAGVGVSTLLAVLLWPVHPYAPVRATVAACHRAIAAYARRLSAEGASETVAREERPRVRALLEKAREALSTVRSAKRGETERGEDLLASYEVAELALGDLVAISDALEAAPASVDLAPIADAFESAATRVEGPAAAASLAGKANAIGETLARERTTPEGELPALRDRLYLHALVALEAATRLGSPSAVFITAPPRRSLRDALSRDSLDLQHALRLATITAAAALLGVGLGLGKRHWITVTAVVVLQPYWGATVRRGLQRVAGTVVGAIAAALLAHLPHGPLIVAIVLFGLAVLASALRTMNYALYSLFATPLFVLMAESSGGDWQLTGLRVINTLIGGGAALLGAHLLWPSWERERLPRVLAAMLRLDAAYLVAVAAGAGAPATLAARRESGLCHANADASLQRLLSEPHDFARIEPLMAIIAMSRRLTGAITAIDASGRKVPAELSAQLAASLEDLARAASGAPLSPLVEMHAEPPLDRLQRPVEVLHAALARLSAQA